MNFLTVTKIISGGQVGADRAGLDFAIEKGIEHGGWCPKGRRAEDGKIPGKYQLSETAESSYPRRTRLNVESSDGTIVFTTRPPGRGSQLTIDLCAELGRPCMVITFDMPLMPSLKRIREWLTEHSIKTLNVAGSRREDSYRMALMALRGAYNGTKEDPRNFLREVKAGLGPAVDLPDGTKSITFEDKRGLSASLLCNGTEGLELVGGGDKITLDPGMARRLANTLERWATTGNFGGA